MHDKKALQQNFEYLKNVLSFPARLFQFTTFSNVSQIFAIKHC